MPKLTLTYFSFANRAEPIRLAAAIGKVAFTHKSLDFPTFAKIKDTLPLGQVPILEIEETDKSEKIVIPQAHSILRYFGKLGGLYPEDPIDVCKVDSIIDTIDDASRPLVLTVQGAVRSLISEAQEWTSEEKIAIRKRVVENQHGFPQYLGFLEKTLQKSGSGWLVGETATIADLRLYQLAIWIDSGILDGIPPSTLDSYPAVKAHMGRIKSLPEVEAWYSEHYPPYGDFDFVPPK